MTSPFNDIMIGYSIGEGKNLERGVRYQLFIVDETMCTYVYIVIA